MKINMHRHTQAPQSRSNVDFWKILLMWFFNASLFVCPPWDNLTEFGFLETELLSTHHGSPLSFLVLMSYIYSRSTTSLFERDPLLHPVFSSLGHGQSTAFLTVQGTVRLRERLYLEPIPSIETWNVKALFFILKITHQELTPIHANASLSMPLCQHLSITEISINIWPSDMASSLPSIWSWKAFCTCGFAECCLPACKEDEDPSPHFACLG